MMGGEDSDGSILSDCWILDPVSRRWSEVNNDDYRALIPYVVQLSH